jgi:transposase
MFPLVKRTWSPKGHRPVLDYKGPREKVSLASALCWAPGKKRVQFLYKTLVDDYLSNEECADFIKQILRKIPGKIIVIWDGGTMHKGGPINNLKEKFSHRLTFEKLPSYAPMLNPIEQVWSWLKYARLSNFTPRNAKHMNRVVQPMLAATAKNQKRLINFWKASELPLPPGETHLKSKD